MKLAFLIESPERFKIEKDTSFALMLKAQEMGHEISIFERGSMTYLENTLYIDHRRVRVTDSREHPFDFETMQRNQAAQFDVIWIRTDPPFDHQYLMDTWLLSLPAITASAHRPKPWVVNSPAGLRTVNEKVWAAQFGSLTPVTLLTTNRTDFRNFLHNHEKVVLKPANGFGGSSIFVTSRSDPNANALFENLAHSGLVIIQEYLPAATQGDKRILLVDGEVLGAVLRLHSADDHRNNFAAGGKAQKAEVTERDLMIVRSIKPALLELELFFVGIDVIGEKLIEVNVTSPTCLREMQQYYAEDLAKIVIQKLEQKLSDERN